MAEKALTLYDTCTGNIKVATGVYSCVAGKEVEIEVNGDKIFKEECPAGKKWSHIHVAIRIVEEAA